MVLVAGQRQTPKTRGIQNSPFPSSVQESVVFCAQSVTCTVLLYAAAFVGPKYRGYMHRSTVKDKTLIYALRSV